MINAEIVPPQSYSDISRYLAERVDSNFEVSVEALERATNPNEKSLRDELEHFSADVRIERLAAVYLVYAKEHGEEKARRYLEYAAQGLLDSSQITRAIDKAALLKNLPNVERHFSAATDGVKRREELTAFAQRRRAALPLKFGIDALDAAIAAGAGEGPGEVLNIVAGEGGQKTSLALRATELYSKSGGNVLFISLDMPAREIELRLMMRCLNCSRDAALWHCDTQDSQFWQFDRVRRETDSNLTIIVGPLGLTQIRSSVLASDAQVVVLDYVSLVSGFKSELEAARAVTEFVRKARTYWGITFVLLSQMSRQSAQAAKQGDTGGHAKGGSSLEQLVDVEIELSTDEPLIPGDKRRLIAFLRKNRNGPSGLSFKLFPLFPAIDFNEHAEPVMRDPAKKKVIFRSGW
jgi:replicative DNA helicase